MSLILSFKVGKCYVGNRTAKDVLRCLADYADDDGGNCFPGRETIITEAEINKSSFSAALRFLESNRFIEVRRRQKNNSNNYRINVARLDQKELYGKADINSSTENQLSEKPVVRKTVQQLYGKADIGCTKNRTTVVRKTVPDSINTQSITQSYTYTSSEQNSDAGEEEHFALTSPEEDTLKPQEPVTKVANRCPIKKFIDIYHETLPMGTPVRTWKSAKRIKSMKARWKELVEDEKCESEEAALSILRDFFINAIASSNFLTGKIAPRNPNDAPFQISLEWILTEGNWDKIVDGHYVNRKKNTPPNNSYPPRGY